MREVPLYVDASVGVGTDVWWDGGSSEEGSYLRLIDFCITQL